VSRLRLGLALAGFGAALLAATIGDRRIGWGAIVLLLSSLIVRLLQRKDDVEHSGDDSSL
jgi:hypothetical protein